MTQQEWDAPTDEYNEKPVLVYMVEKERQQRERIKNEIYGGSDWLMEYCTTYGFQIMNK